MSLLHSLIDGLRVLNRCRQREGVTLRPQYLTNIRVLDNTPYIDERICKSSIYRSDKYAIVQWHITIFIDTWHFAQAPYAYSAQHTDSNATPNYIFECRNVWLHVYETTLFIDINCWHFQLKDLVELINYAKIHLRIWESAYSSFFREYMWVEISLYTEGYETESPWPVHFK